MSYIINCTSPFTSTKLTEIGRKKLAMGKLNFAFWSIGDSEINYQREELIEDNPGVAAYSATTIIQRPKDKQVNFRSFITKTVLTSGDSPLYDLTSENIRTLKLTVNNEAEDRGFFSGTTDAWVTLTGDSYVTYASTIAGTVLTGGTYLEIGTGATYNIGDFILLKLTNSTLGPLSLNTNLEPTPNLWFKIQDSASTNTIIVDRNLPNLSGDSTVIQFYIYPNGEVYNTFGSGTTTAYWDSNTLSFDASCDVSVHDVDVWNMNIPFSETIQGITANTFENYSRYGSYNYIGQKEPFFNYPMVLSDEENQSLTAFCLGDAIRDSLSKSLAIIHYTNKTISNFYGEFLYIDTENDKLTKLHLPTLMYHRRYFSGGTATGNLMGMSFVSSGTSKVITDTDIEYYDLIEDPSLLVSGTTPNVVGKVFPQLKIVVIDDDEIIMAMSYKSNRNWTLPSLSLSLQAPAVGNTGVLKQNETLFMTYILTNSSGLTSSAPCQYYAKIKNGSATERDIQFRISETDLLPYMRKIESGSYDGRGFYADSFKILYQIVDEDSDRPTSDGWLLLDYTNSGMTSGGTIDPKVLENQTPAVNSFTLTYAKSTGATQFDLAETLNLPLNTEPELLQFGDERFFYGNIESYIGATIYKTLFEIKLNAGEFKYTNNTTKILDDGDPTNIRVSEIGVYDSDSELVIIGKLSQPVELTPGSVITFELGLDF